MFMDYKRLELALTSNEFLMSGCGLLARKLKLTIWHHNVHRIVRFSPFNYVIYSKFGFSHIWSQVAELIALPQVFLRELQLNLLWVLGNAFSNTMAQKFLGKKFIPRFAKYLIIFPYY